MEDNMRISKRRILVVIVVLIFLCLMVVEWMIVENRVSKPSKPSATVGRTTTTAVATTTVATTTPTDYQARAREEYAEEIAIMAKIIYLEARGIHSQTEQACVGWVILNRYDSKNWAQSLRGVMLSPNQFAYRDSAPTVDDFGRDLKELSASIFGYWIEEGDTGSCAGRVLPKDYYYFSGWGGRNHFRQGFESTSYWNYSLPSPYSN